MQERELIAGFSELKDLLIEAYKIDRDRLQVRLHFSRYDDEILMHDYDDHKKLVEIVTSVDRCVLSSKLQG